MDMRKMTILEMTAMKTAMASDLNKTPEDIEKMTKDLAGIVDDHALGAGACSAATAWVPGTGTVIASAAMVGFVCTMYTRLNNRMGLDLSGASLKKLASGLMRYLMYSAASIGGTKVISTLLSMTGVGNAASSILMAAVDYGVTKIGGIVYLNIIGELMAEGRDIEQLNEEELEALMKSAVQNTDVKTMMKQMKNEYAEGRKNGTITGEEKVEPACEN